MALWQKALNTLRSGRAGGGCHGARTHLDGDYLSKEGIVGSPNVGKSVVFNNVAGLNDKIAP